MVAKIELVLSARQKHKFGCGQLCDRRQIARRKPGRQRDLHELADIGIAPDWKQTADLLDRSTSGRLRALCQTVRIWKLLVHSSCIPVRTFTAGGVGSLPSASLFGSRPALVLRNVITKLENEASRPAAWRPTKATLAAALTTA